MRAAAIVAVRVLLFAIGLFWIVLALVKVMQQDTMFAVPSDPPPGPGA